MSHNMNSIYPSIRAAKLRLLAMHHTANAGHIGGNLSCIDALMVLYHSVLGPEDRFILSKGHSAGALYVSLWSVGRLSDADLETFTKDDTLLPGHPSGLGIPGLLFSTGSLGHGPSIAVGLAMAARYQRSNRQIYCMCSDGEWQEGSCWEALGFAVHQRLDNLTILVDQNGLQGLGTTEEVASCSDLSPRLAAFGPDIESINGHDPVAIEASLRRSPEGRPKIVVLNTIKGHGLHFEGLVESHYLPLTEDQYIAARARILEDRA